MTGYGLWEKEVRQIWLQRLWPETLRRGKTGSRAGLMVIQLLTEEHNLE